MKNLNITAEAVKQAFKNAGKDGKQVLTDLFGKQVSLYDNITEGVKYFEDACQVLGIPTNVPDVKGLPRKHAKAMVAMYKLITIAEAWNKADNFVPDYDNINQYKYSPWFQKQGAAGFVYAGTAYTASLAYAGTGSRLCFSTSERAEQFGKQFVDLWNDFLLFR